MSIRVLRRGLQTTIQASPRIGQRHLGVPASGPADPLSMALANHLVGNDLLLPALEATLTGVDLRFESASAFALAGAPSDAALNGRPAEFLQTYNVKAGDELCIGAATSGARVYVAVAGGLVADRFLGSQSTYLPAAFGGYKGRVLEVDDSIEVAKPATGIAEKVTPVMFRLPITDSWALRATKGIEFSLLETASGSSLFDTNFRVGNRNDRMGLQLDGQTLTVASRGRLPSSPVFPGTVQCPEDGTPFMLSVDAQTTGGYARVAQVARADRHLIGQLRPGSHLRLLQRSPDEAIQDLREKLGYWRAWLPGIDAVI